MKCARLCSVEDHEVGFRTHTEVHDRKDAKGVRNLGEMIREDDGLIRLRLWYLFILGRPAVTAGVLGDLPFLLQEDIGLRRDIGEPPLARFVLRDGCARRSGLARSAPTLLACNGC